MTALQESRITAQHETINKMIRDIQALAGRPIDRERLIKMLTVFMNYVKAHFDNEEKIMLRKGYRSLSSHKADHGRIIETMALIIQVCGDRNMSINDDIGDNIHCLLDEHMKTCDNEMMAYLDRVG